MAADGIGHAARAELVGAGYIRQDQSSWWKFGTEGFALVWELQTRRRWAGFPVMTALLSVVSPAYGAFRSGVALADYDQPGLPLLSFCLYPPVEASLVVAMGRSDVVYDAPEWQWHSDADSAVGVAFLSHLRQSLTYADILNSAAGLSHFYRPDSPHDGGTRPVGPERLKPVSFFDPDTAVSLIRAQVGDVEGALDIVLRPADGHTSRQLDSSDRSKADLVSWLHKL